MAFKELFEDNTTISDYEILEKKSQSISRKKKFKENKIFKILFIFSPCKMENGG